MYGKVKIISAVGTEFGLIRKGSKQEELTIIMRRPGEEWPHGLEPDSGLNTIAEGHTSYVVMDEEYFKEQQKPKDVSI